MPSGRLGTGVATEAAGGRRKGNLVSGFVLWVIAAILVIIGIVQLLQGQIILGIVLIVAGCLVGPGGYSIFGRRTS